MKHVIFFSFCFHLHDTVVHESLRLDIIDLFSLDVVVLSGYTAPLVNLESAEDRKDGDGDGEEDVLLQQPDHRPADHVRDHLMNHLVRLQSKLYSNLSQHLQKDLCLGLETVTYLSQHVRKDFPDHVEVWVRICFSPSPFNTG